MKRLRDKSLQARYVKERRHRIKVALVQLTGSACTQCGYSACLAGLEFHHPDDETKDFGLSQRGLIRSYIAMAEEVSKTVLLCCRCHREAHHLPGFVLKGSPIRLTPDEIEKTVRSLETRMPSRGTFKHGTGNGYNNHKCRCALCIEYHRLAHQRFRKKKRSEIQQSS